jgi:hypothetical protein
MQPLVDIVSGLPTVVESVVSFIINLVPAFLAIALFSGIVILLQAMGAFKK